MCQVKTKKSKTEKKMLLSSVQLLLFTVQAVQLKTDYSEHTRQAQSTASVVSSPVISICPPLSDLLKKYDTRLLGGGARKTLSLSPVSAVWEKSIKVSMLDSSIFYCVNLIPSHGERKMSGWFEGKR